MMYIPLSLIPYAAIDLKNATIYIKDGYGLTGAVNNVAGYSSGDATMIVDGFTTAVETGNTFNVEGQTTKYTITNHTETLGATTSITFTPALTANVDNDDVITIRPHELEVKVGEGNLTYSEKKPRTYVKNRGALDTVKDADEEPMEVSMDFVWEFLKADTDETPTVEDALKKRGQASTWVSSSDDACEPYAVDIEIFYNPPCDDSKNERITLEDFRYESLDHDLRNSSVACSGKCNALEATIERTTATY